ncbi:MAG TPA: tetratricopeptide repeat protein [Terriglobales bacterium]|nr:tetratricopeptide repeat protein [Terriglobales bacterium]
MRLITCAIFFFVFAPNLCGQPQHPASGTGPTERTPRPFPASEAPQPSWLSLPGSGLEPPLPGGTTVSVSNLLIPSSATKELRHSQQSFQSGDLRDTVKHLEKAIRIHPQLPAAHHNLGVCYVRLREYDKAVTEFQNASALDSHLVQPLVSLSGVFFLLARYEEGVAAARRALDLDPLNSTTRYLLGIMLAAEGRDTPEVVELLRKSPSKFPAAHLVLASIFLKRNATEEAVGELREYLQQPEAPEKEKVACMVERLTQPSGNHTCAIR